MIISRVADRHLATRGIPSLALIALLGSCGPPADAGPAASADAAPVFQVDPTWPQELPNDWILGSVTGVFVDARDHVWITHLPETLTPEETSAVQAPPLGTCCVPAPMVLELDPEGALVQAWGEWPVSGGPGEGDPERWPRNPHGIFVDHQDFVWVGTYQHHRVMKFTRD